MEYDQQLFFAPPPVMRNYAKAFLPHHVSGMPLISVRSAHWRSGTDATAFTRVMIMREDPSFIGALAYQKLLKRVGMAGATVIATALLDAALARHEASHSTRADDINMASREFENNLIQDEVLSEIDTMSDRSMRRLVGPGHHKAWRMLMIQLAHRVDFARVWNKVTVAPANACEEEGAA